MPLLFDDKLGCHECGHQEFREKEVVRFRKDLRDRQSEEEKLDAYDRYYIYECNKCGHKLNK